MARYTVGTTGGQSFWVADRGPLQRLVDRRGGDILPCMSTGERILFLLVTTGAFVVIWSANGYTWETWILWAIVVVFGLFGGRLLAPRDE